ncbi:MAG: hypothetical protein Fur0010_22100 [Bdellovibrio sp.]
MKEIRLFPRYDIRKLKSPIEVDYQIKSEWTIKDIGLGGLQIRSKNPITLNETNKRIKILLFGKEEVFLNITQMWTEERKDEYLSGFKLYFDDMQMFVRWRNILKALHIVLNKKRN